MSEQVYFHFTLGPVQSFVSQARRTRDFWAGSFILSWLSGVAVCEVIAQCKGSENAKAPWLDEDLEVIQFPKPERLFIEYLNGSQTGKENAPRQGSIPNRFKAKVDKASFKPELVSEAVHSAWEALAKIVYQADFEDNLSAIQRDNPEWQVPSKVLWDRQIKGCWDINWSYSPILDPELGVTRETPVLDQRKNWRNYAAPIEPGVKCMMMDGWQELSGVLRPKEQDLEAFWRPLRESTAKMTTDIREKEFLCAIAFVKRRFPRHFDKLSNIEMPSKWHVQGWLVDESRPSVSYMAAAHWWAETLKQAEVSSELKNRVSEFHREASELTESHSGWHNNIKCVDDVPSKKEWKALDGDVLYESVLENPRSYPETKWIQAEKTLAALKAIKRESTMLGAPPAFYAVLMMDGDLLGKQMTDISKQFSIAEGLQRFTKQVPIILQKHNGFLVYAGGDDVLAVLPCEDALVCALAVREWYEEVFSDYRDKGITTSISAAIEFAHVRMPLMKVLKGAHKLLDEIAKDQTGRDALAVRVLKPGGTALQWAQPWAVACEGVGNNKRVVLDRLAEEFAQYDKEYDSHSQYSNKFFYKIRECLSLFNPPQGSDESSVLLEVDGNGENHAVNLMAAEYVDSGLCQQVNTQEGKLDYARTKVEPLITQCCSVSGRYEADAALLVRFLAQKGVM